MMLLLPLLGVLASVPAPAAPRMPAVVEDQGIRVAFDATAQAKEGEPISFAFNITETTNATPIGSVRPAAWLSRHVSARVDCTRKVATFLGGDLFGRPEVDLNAYFVLALNDDASVSVVDPLFGFGGSKLLAMLPLEAPGEDWALSSDQKQLYITMPSAGKVAIADTWRWQVAQNVVTGRNPRRLIAGERIWVADDEGLTFIDPRTFRAGRLKVGRVHDLVFNDDRSAVFAVTDGAVVIIDVHTRRKSGAVMVAGNPSIVAWSSAGKSLYALDAEGGKLFVVDPRQRKLTTTIDVEPGATQLRFAPNGRHALLPNPRRNLVQVLDAATNRIVQNAEIGEEPDRITFTPQLAYIRRRASETVLMAPLEQIGLEGKPLGVADFPGGQHGYGAGTAGSVADSIVESPEGPSVLVANPADRMIYLYKEGMAAPAGGFATYGKQPRAVLVVDRGLREARPGHYETTVPVTKPGKYDVVFFLDTPRVVACFSIDIAPSKPVAEKRTPRVAAIAPPEHLVAGQPAQLRFALLDPVRNERRRAGDVRALAFEAPGVWQQRGELAPHADGTYAFEFIPPSSGIYYVWLESESLGLESNNSQYLVIEAR